MRVCPKCGGQGSYSPDKLLECPWCLDGILMILINSNCEECKGTGNVTKTTASDRITSSCPICIPKGNYYKRLPKKERMQYWKYGEG